MSDFKVIRCGTGFGLVIAVTPADATPDTEGAKFYRYASWDIGKHKAKVFNEISKLGAMGYFGGIADGIGFEKEHPAQVFTSLESLHRFVRSKHEEHMKKLLDECIANQRNTGGDK